ncbi:MAG: ABC transporter permease [Candidatus Korarchaeota archaeon]|nr:ABC transporter permease [Candidatus Korarchaeota archaeon]
MNPILQMAKKDLISFFRSKSTIFWTLAFPLMMMLLFSSMFGGGGGARYKIALVNEDHGMLASVFVKALNSTNVTVLIPYEDLKEAKDFVVNKEGVAVLIIPQGFSENLTSGRSAEIKLLVEDDPQLRVIITNMIAGFIDSFSDEYRRRALEYIERGMPEVIHTERGNFTRQQILGFLMSIGRPIELEAASISKPEVTSETVAYWDNQGHWVSVMLTYSLIFSGMVSAAAMLAHEKMIGTIKRVIASPASRWSLLAGKMLGGLVILSASQVILVALTILWLRPDVNWTPLLIPVILAGDLASMSLGLLVTEASPDPKAANEAIITVGVLIQFISGLYFPLEFLPAPLRAVAEVIPFTWAVKTMDGLLVRGLDLAAVMMPTLYLTVAAALFTSLAVVLFPRWARVE